MEKEKQSEIIFSKDQIDIINRMIGKNWNLKNMVSETISRRNQFNQQKLNHQQTIES